MGSDSLLTALPAFPVPNSNLATAPALAKQQSALRKSAIWRLSRSQPHGRRGIKEDPIAEEDEATVSKVPVSSRSVSPIDMAVHGDRRRVSDDDDEYDSSVISADEPADECEDDRCRGPEPPIWHCVDCDSSYCR